MFHRCGFEEVLIRFVVFFLSYDLLASSQNWRRDNNVDQILQTFPMSPYFKPLMQYWPSTYLGDFFSGYKVFYERLGDVEVKHLLRAIPLDALVSYHIYILESQEREYVTAN
jgi:hypothetical protein